MYFSNLVNSTFKKWLGVIGVSLAAAGSFAAENSAPTGSSERCIQIKDIRRTEVVDDSNILFYLRNKQVYNNRLPHRCGGLAQADAFKYETSQSELCNVDIISVLNSSTGELLPGASCGLGLFEPVDPKSIDPKSADAKADNAKKPVKD